MFNQISWRAFIIFSFAIILCWYLYLILKYHRKQIRRVLNDKDVPDSSVFDDEEFNAKTEENNSDDDLLPFEDEFTDDAFVKSGELIHRIKELITVAKIEKYSRTAFVNSMASLIQDYPEVDTPAFRVAINNQISLEIRSANYIHLSDDDLDMLWTR